MLSTPRAPLEDKLLRVELYGYFDSEPIRALAIRMSKRLLNEAVSAPDFVTAYVGALNDLCRERPDYTVGPKHGGLMYSNLLAQMCNIATALISKEFSDEAFKDVSARITLMELETVSR